MVQAIQQPLVHKFIEKLHFLRGAFQHIGDDVLQHILSQTHIVLQVGKGNFWFNHPEFGGMTGRVGIFRPEGGAEGVDIAEGHGKGFAIELAGDGQIGGLPIEILGVIHGAVLVLGHIVQIQRCDLKHFTCTLTVGTGNQRRMHIDKIPILEELVNGHGSQTADAEHGLESVGAGAEMGNCTQKLHGVPFGLQGIITGGGAFHGNRLCLNLKGLLGVRSQLDGAAYNQRGADIDLGNLLKIIHGIIIYNLNGVEISTVI